MTELLGKLFGSLARVKIMRLFFLNPLMSFDKIEIEKRTRVKKNAIGKELNILKQAKFIKDKPFIREIKRTKGKKIKIIKKRTPGFILNENFPLMTPLQSLIVNSSYLDKKEVSSRFKGAGKIRLLVLAGIFLEPETISGQGTVESTGPLDVLVVGDNLKRRIIDEAVKVIEAEIGKELAYAAFDTEDFKYRMSMYDKLIRDVFDNPHQKIIENKLPVDGF
jgi:hypothetical protein